MGLERSFCFDVRFNDPQDRNSGALVSDATIDVSFEAMSLAVLPSGRAILLALLAFFAFYVARALWIARHEWKNCGADTKLLYLLVAPILTFAVDILEITDRLFWSGQEKPAHPRRGTGEAATARTG